jgi:beta-lactam-binding protein with PASTA domain
MALSRNLARITCEMLVGLATALTVIGVVVGCSSEETPAPAAIVMPDLVGKYWLDAEPQLRSVGWTGFLIKGPDVPAGPQDRYTVMSQDPAAGEPLDADSAITLRFGS